MADVRLILHIAMGCCDVYNYKGGDVLLLLSLGPKLLNLLFKGFYMKTYKLRMQYNLEGDREPTVVIVKANEHLKHCPTCESIRFGKSILAHNGILLDGYSLGSETFYTRCKGCDEVCLMTIDDMGNFTTFQRIIAW